MRPTHTAIKHTIIAATLATGIFAATPASAEEVYMIRGFLNVFSDGINQMTRALKSRGIRASALSNGDWNAIASNIIRRAKRGAVSYPIVIVGHSLGGVEAPNFANALVKGGVKVRLVIGLDPGFANPVPFGPGVTSVIDYKIPNGHSYRRGRGFNGRMKNIVINGVDHVGIDKSPSIQRRVLSNISVAIRG